MPFVFFYIRRYLTDKYFDLVCGYPQCSIIFCSLYVQKVCVRTFLEMTNICNTCEITHVQQCVCSTICLCAVNLCVCAVSESCEGAHSLEGALSTTPGTPLNQGRSQGGAGGASAPPKFYFAPPNNFS